MTTKVPEGTVPRYVDTCWGSHPCQAQHPIVKVTVCEDIGQAVVIMVLFRVQLKELLHPNVGEAKWVAWVLHVICGVDLKMYKRLQYLQDPGSQLHSLNHPATRLYNQTLPKRSAATKRTKERATLLTHSPGFS